MQIAGHDRKLRTALRLMAAAAAIRAFRSPSLASPQRFPLPTVSQSKRYLCFKGRYRAEAFWKGVRMSRKYYAFVRSS